MQHQSSEPTRDYGAPHLPITSRSKSPMSRHACPYVAISAACICRRQPCGGIIPEADCPDHGHARNPVMEWHFPNDPLCQRLTQQLSEPKR